MSLPIPLPMPPPLLLTLSVGLLTCASWCLVFGSLLSGQNCPDAPRRTHDVVARCLLSFTSTTLPHHCLAHECAPLLFPFLSLFEVTRLTELSFCALLPLSPPKSFVARCFSASPWLRTPGDPAVICVWVLQRSLPVRRALLLALRLFAGHFCLLCACSPRLSRSSIDARTLWTE